LITLVLSTRTPYLTQHVCRRVPEDALALSARETTQYKYINMSKATIYAFGTLNRTRTQARRSPPSAAAARAGPAAAPRPRPWLPALGTSAAPWPACRDALEGEGAWRLAWVPHGQIQRLVASLCLLCGLIQRRLLSLQLMRPQCHAVVTDGHRRESATLAQQGRSAPPKTSPPHA